MKPLYFLSIFFFFCFVISCENLEKTNKFEALLSHPAPQGILLGANVGQSWEATKKEFHKDLTIDESGVLFFAKKTWNNDPNYHFTGGFGVENDTIKYMEFDLAATGNEGKREIGDIRQKIYDKLVRYYNNPDSRSKSEAVWIRRKLEIRMSTSAYVKDMDQQYFTLKVKTRD